MPYCKNCGNKLDNDTKFCPKCGTPVKSISVDPRINNTDQLKTIKRKGKSPYSKINLKNLTKGFLIDERYKIISKLGQGGFGAVYRAHDNQMEIDKALKVLPEAITNDIEAMTDLRAEAKTMVALNHPNIIRVYDLHTDSKIQYIDMEYIDGKTLTEIKLKHQDKKVPEEKVRKYAIQIAEGLAYAHSNNIIHKDIKPQNVMVNSQGQVKIMDFGIAETVRTSMSRIANSSSSGTLVYMSPEQIRGKNLGKEADIYSFGAMLYELLSGHPPFYKGAIEHQILNKNPQAMDNVSRWFNDIILKCLAKNYQQRYTEFGDIIRFLKEEVDVEDSNKNVARKTIKKNTEIDAKPLTKNLKINSIPKGAHVQIDGHKTDNVTPANIQLEFGEHEINIFKEGYYSDERTITINESSDDRIKFELEKLNKQCYDFISKNLVWVEGGSFDMGDVWDCGNKDEKPVHKVTVDTFYIGKYQVTQKLWMKIMDENPSQFKGEKRPVENISWREAVKFCNRLSKKHKLEPCYEIYDKKIVCDFNATGYRLPTEAEWEYAARSKGRDDRKWSGTNDKNELDKYAWYNKNSGKKIIFFNHGPHNVSQKRPNDLGLYDMSGNIYEWCNDWYDKNYYTHSPITNPKGSEKGNHKVLRGGDWESYEKYCLTIYRHYSSPSNSTSYIGFRIAKN